MYKGATMFYIERILRELVLNVMAAMLPIGAGLPCGPLTSQLKVKLECNNRVVAVLKSFRVQELGYIS